MVKQVDKMQQCYKTVEKGPNCASAPTNLLGAILAIAFLLGCLKVGVYAGRTVKVPTFISSIES